ncbi:RNA polymerase sigma factor [Pedobacter aquatilis]|uniref:RNA polymerase sigma factor n=1 Tax=Pedobacter aquatilis TaxID=351343 RepID=UPI00292DA4BC|nr:RNA polymerase sigma factor [Pedobacter aquatilis]
MTQSSFSVQAMKHAPALLCFAKSFTNNTDDAQDLLQDTLVKALRYYQQFEQGSNLKAWLYTIMRNTFINDYRRRAKTISIIQQSEEISSHDLFRSASQNAGESNLILKDVHKALKKLPECYAFAFVKHFEGWKYHEIAEELGIPVGTVKTRIHCARKLLKEQLMSHSRYAYKAGQA